MTEPQTAYFLGVVQAFRKLGMHEQNRQLPLEQLTGDSLGSASMTDAEQFTEFAKEDKTEDVVNGPHDLQPDYDKPVHWGGKSPLESGDAGTRNHSMGLPTFNGV